MKKFITLLAFASFLSTQTIAAPLYIYQPIGGTGGGGGGTPGGSSGQVQYNNVGAFGGITGATTDGTTLTTASQVLNGTVSGTAVGSTSAASTLVQRNTNQNTFANSFVSAGQTIATAGGTTTLTVSSPRYVVFTGTLSQTLVLPDATTLTANESTNFDVNNNSSGTITINNNVGTTIYSVLPQSDVKINLLTNSIAAGTWDVHSRSPSIVAWAAGGTTPGIQMNTTLSTTPLISSGVSSATSPGFVPMRSDPKAGIGADAAGDVSVIANNAGTATEIIRATGAAVTVNKPMTTGTINKVTLTAPATGSTLTIADGKTLTASNSLTFAGTDSSTLNIGTGGVLGTAAFSATGTSGATLCLLNAATCTYSGVLKGAQLWETTPNQVIGSPLNPTGVTSTTPKMMGLGTVVHLAPTFSGRFRITVTGFVTAASAESFVQIYYGTGTAPVNGAAATGTAVGNQAVLLVPAAAGSFITPFTIIEQVTGLTLSTSYWFDLGVNCTVNSMSVGNIRYEVTEY